MTTDLNTLLTALYVKIDDWLGRPNRREALHAMLRDKIPYQPRPTTPITA
ncbi:hypothetical protein ABT023_21795 [Micromonospora sp. NPDC002296]